MQDATCTSQMKEVGNTDLRIACGYAHVVKALNSGRPGTVQMYKCTSRFWSLSIQGDVHNCLSQKQKVSIYPDLGK